jgi:hypothetical protein
MSSTRRASDGEFHQERFCSAPEFQGDAINGLAAAKRIAIVKDRSTREILWWLQWLSLTPGSLQQLVNELIEEFPDRIGTRSWRRLKQRNQPHRILTQEEIRELDKEFDPRSPAMDISYMFLDSERDDPEKPDFLVTTLVEFSDLVDCDLRDLGDVLVRFCLDPEADIAKGVWYFEDLLGALRILRERSIAAARSRLADTAVTRKINETLDFCYSRRRLVLIEGVAGIGRSETAKAWCEAHAGIVRYVEVPSSGDDRSFYSAVARSLGIARGFAYNPQQIKLRVEDMLAASGLMLVLDESQFLWPQVQRPRGVPPRMLWTKTLFDAGTPVAMIALDDFSLWQALYVEKTLWTDQQFERRLNRRVALQVEHSKEDMLKIARAHFPAGNSRSWKLLSSYALGTEKKQASGIVEALESARYRAELAGRAEPTFEDIEAALIHDHGFMCSTSRRATRAKPDTSAADRLHGLCNGQAKPVRSTGDESDFPIRVRPSGGRITTPTVAL